MTSVFSDDLHQRPTKLAHTPYMSKGTLSLSKDSEVLDVRKKI